MNKPIPAPAPSPLQVGLILVAGVCAVSTGAVFIRLAIAANGSGGVGFSLFLAAARLIFASLLLLPVWRTIHPPSLQGGGWKYACGAGLCLALHFASWITSLSFTSIAASTTLVTTNPLWVALISWLWFKEVPTRMTVLGIGVAFLGGVCIAMGDSGEFAGSQPLLGNGLAVLGAIMASLYFLLGREAQRRGLGIGHYAAIAYGTGATALLPLPLLVEPGYAGYPLGVYGYALLMAIASQVIGHTALNWSVRWVSPTLVTLVLLFEPVGSSILGYLMFGEIPGILVLVGAAVVLVGVAIAILGNWEHSKV